MTHRRDLISSLADSHPAVLPHGLALGSEARPVDADLLAFGADFDTVTARNDSAGGDVIRIAWVDTHNLTRECIMAALRELYPRITVFPFNSTAELLTKAHADIDIIIYHSHALDTGSLQDVSDLQKGFGDIPVIVLSDIHDANHLRIVREALQNGAHGFISTRTSSIRTAVAAIRFVKAGGTFAPLDLLIGDEPIRVVEKAEPVETNLLTQRQMAVLAHLHQGKANKIIAHELGMSESTVKVHVRNIMRKMGATNRTQAAFKAQKICAASSALAMAAL